MEKYFQILAKGLLPKTGFIVKSTSTVTKMILTSEKHHKEDFGSDL